jgi:hypothetical protein
MASKVIISSVPNFITMIQQHPALLQIPAFASVKQVITSLSNQNAKCIPCKAKKVISDNRKVFEAAITSLQPHEKQQMKTILGASEVCYYTLNNNSKLSIVCF